MTSQAQALIRCPAYAPRFLGSAAPRGRPSESRARHLFEVQIPMLFIQGTRDALAEHGLLEALVGRLGARATLSCGGCRPLLSRAGPQRPPRPRSEKRRVARAADWIGSLS